jgi:lipopolysaccharide transport system permease protein
LWSYRELLVILVQRDLKVRYKNSVLGFGWSLINPLIQVLTITLVLRVMMKGGNPNYSAYVFCATLPWLFFSTAVLDASPSLVLYHTLVRRTYFPREIIPLATIIANLIHFLLAWSVFLAYTLVSSLFWWAVLPKHPLVFMLQPTALLSVIPLAGLVLLATGIGLVLSVWTLWFEDIRFITDSFMRILYWLVPVLYYPDTFLHLKNPDRGALYYTIYMMNPLSAFITSIRKLVLAPTEMPGDTVMTTPMGAPEWSFLAAALVTSVGVAYLGHRYFAARKWRLAERG